MQGDLAKSIDLLQDPDHNRPETNAGSALQNSRQTHLHLTLSRAEQQQRHGAKGEIAAGVAGLT
jgi:hypothetical protein